PAVETFCPQFYRRNRSCDTDAACSMWRMRSSFTTLDRHFGTRPNGIGFAQLEVGECAWDGDRGRDQGGSMARGIFFSLLLLFGLQSWGQTTSLPLNDLKQDQVQKPAEPVPPSAAET